MSRWPSARWPHAASAFTTVVNFPSGEDSIDDVVLSPRPLADGADEIDLVLPYRRFLAGDTVHAAAMVDAVHAASAGHTLKVILETGELPDAAAIRSAAELAVARGADFVDEHGRDFQPAPRWRRRPSCSTSSATSPTLSA